MQPNVYLFLSLFTWEHVMNLQSNIRENTRKLHQTANSYTEVELWVTF